MMGRLQVQVALRPDLAPKLVIGGMPRSNVPMLLSLLALTRDSSSPHCCRLRREYELSRLRADFVSGVSHELRTPLAQIRMFRRPAPGPRPLRRRARALARDHRPGGASTDPPVENLLHFSRSERRLARLSPAPAPLAPLVSEAAEGFAPLAAARGVTLCSELTDGVVGAGRRRRPASDAPQPARQRGEVRAVGPDRDPWPHRGDGRARVSVDDEGPGIPAARARAHLGPVLATRAGPRLGRGRHGHRPVRGARARSAARRSHLGGGRAASDAEIVRAAGS